MFWRRKPEEATEEPADSDEWKVELPAEPPAPPAEPPASAPAAAAPAPAAPPAPKVSAPKVSAPKATAPAPSAPAPVEPSPDETPGDLAAGLEKSRGGFMSRLRGLLRTGGPTDEEWEEVEETLIAGDVGGALAARVVEQARSRRDAVDAQSAVREELAGLLVRRDHHWQPVPAAAGQPVVILVVGVNGTGKTTTIGKLAHRYRAEGKSVLLAAADTFRAAAIDQLRIWADRAGCQFVAHIPGADPAAVVYDAIDAAIARDVDVVIADTAGRLHTKSNLMDELAKIRRVIDRRLPGANPEVLFVLDATTGQNGLAQARVFNETVGISGIVLTKLDSTSKGGIVFAIEDTLGVPVRFVGVGERLGDLLPFDPQAFVEALFA